MKSLFFIHRDVGEFLIMLKDILSVVLVIFIRECQMSTDTYFDRIKLIILLSSVCDKAPDFLYE